MSVRNAPVAAVLSAGLVLGAALGTTWPTPAAAEHDGSTTDHIGGPGGHQGGGQHGRGAHGLKRGQKPTTATGPGRGHDVEGVVFRVPTDHTDDSHGPPAGRGSEQGGGQAGAGEAGRHDTGVGHETEDNAEHTH